jgi:ABC-2 type transport system permease protein
MEYLRLLIWLKWQLLTRTFRGSASSLFGAIIAILVFLPLSLVIATGCAFGYRELPPPVNEQLLRAVLLGVYLFWLVTPLLGYALSDSYDISKLFLFPLTSRQIFTGAILGSMIDFPVLLLLPTLLAAIIGFGHSLAAVLLSVPAIALFLFHTLSLSQAAILASSGFLRSRRSRDLVKVLVPFLWISFYVFTRLLTRQLVQLDWTQFLHSRTWAVLTLLPPGLTARAVAAASQGSYAPSVGYLIVLAAVSALTVYLAGWLVERACTGEGINLAGVTQRPRGSTQGEPAEHRPEDRSERTGVLAGRLPPVVAAMVEKETRYIFREPYFKLALMNLVYMLFVFGFALVGGRRSDGMREVGPGMVWGASAWILLSEMSLVFNLFGTEGGAAAVLFLYPSSRRQILIGKNLTLFIALSIVNLLYVLVLAVIGGATGQIVPLACWTELALLVFIAVGNLTSIWLPTRLVAQGWRIQQQSASKGCGFGIMYLGMALIVYVLLLPVLAALLLPTFWIAVGWYGLTIPLAFGYAVGLYLLSLHLAEPMLLARERYIVDQVGRRE